MPPATKTTLLALPLFDREDVAVRPAEAERRRRRPTSRRPAVTLPAGLERALDVALARRRTGDAEGRLAGAERRVLAELPGLEVEARGTCRSAKRSRRCACRASRRPCLGDRHEVGLVDGSGRGGPEHRRCRPAWAAASRRGGLAGGRRGDGGQDLGQVRPGDRRAKQRPQPVQSTSPKRAGVDRELVLTRWRKRAFWSWRGLWPEACT